jgi:hypothetical protein
MTERDLEEWDAEIEAEFQRVVRGTEAAGRRKRGRRHIGAPLAFVAEVCRRTEGRTTLIVALCIYRQTCVHKSRTVTLPAGKQSVLAEQGIGRNRKHEALAKLEAAGLVRIEEVAVGQLAKVTLLWRP